MQRLGFTTNKYAQQLSQYIGRTPTEHFHTTFKFRPFYVYRIQSEDGKYELAVKTDTMDKTVYVVPTNMGFEAFPLEQRFIFIDSDTGYIAFFDSMLPYFNISMDTAEATTVQHTDKIDTEKSISQFVFDNDGAIRCLVNKTFYLGCTEPKETNAVPLQLLPEALYKKAKIQKFKYNLQFDCRDLYGSYKDAMAQAAITNTGKENVETLKKLLTTYMQRADIEINYRDNILKGYENNWYIQHVINGGKTPSSQLISERTFAKQVKKEGFGMLPNMGVVPRRTHRGHE